MFKVGEAILLVSRDIDAAFAREELRMDAVTWDTLTTDRLAGRKVLVVSETDGDGLVGARELESRGMGFDDVGFVPLGYGRLLRDVPKEELRNIFSNPRDLYWDHTRRFSDWEDDPPLQTVPSSVEGLALYLKWTLPAVAVIVGGYSSGKSIIAQMFGMELAIEQGWRVSLCQWEDRRRGARDRLWHSALGTGLDDFEQARPGTFNTSSALELERKVWWTEPVKVDDKGLERYFERCRHLSERYGIQVFVADPWNEFEHDDSGERETMYVRRMMRMAGDVSRELKCLFIIATHLPKAGYADSGNVKPFRIVNAAGSAEFGNKADYGICVAKTKIFHAIVNGLNLNYEDFFSAAKIDGLRAQLGELKGEIHTILAIDKIKIEGEMGQQGVFAYVLDKQTNKLRLDPLATFMAQRVWSA